MDREETIKVIWYSLYLVGDIRTEYIYISNINVPYGDLHH